MRRVAILFVIASFFVEIAWGQSPKKPGSDLRQAWGTAAFRGAAYAASKSIDPERIRAHVKFLASDLLEGRGTGQRGGDIAAEYIATQFALYRLKPAGDNGTYLQKVPLMGITTQPETSFSILPTNGSGMNLKMRDDFVATNEALTTSTDIDADVIYVGYGIEAPEYHWDDYKDAADNATGCGILLELARAYASAAQKPRRSIIFASVTAEEQGLRGSEYLGEHPPIPAGKITLDVNYDDVPPLGVPEETEVVGAERTTFYPVVERTAKQFGLEIKPDARPEAGHYYRSDHFSLARVGVPSFSINEGMKYKGHSLEWGKQKAQEYTDKHYHQPSDEYRPEMDFRGDAAMAHFGFALAWEAANQPRLIAWKAGDEFEAARKKSQAIQTSSTQHGR